MGHTTRCLPLIGHLLAQGHEPVFAGNEWQRQFVGAVFPDVELEPLEGYEVRWTGKMISFLAQVPRHTGNIRREHEWLQSRAKKLGLKGIISDNRYGLYHPDLPSVILTHQLQPLSGMGPLADTIARRTHERMLQRFGQVWVVDVPGSGLAGRLSHPQDFPANASYIGLLSSFSRRRSEDVEKGALLVLLSGPEPQRSMLSQVLKERLANYKGPLYFVEGSPHTERGRLPPDALQYGRLSPKELTPLLQRAEYVVCRSGYSTIMDLVALGKKAILIPTPGQTEQEYLAGHLQQYSGFGITSQGDADIEGAIASMSERQSPLVYDEGDFRRFVPVLDKWTEGL
jgi:UDP:flavonoid glycosyltransferase YjiC (YdhE family)